MAKTINITNYYNAYYILRGKWVRIDHCDCVDEEDKETIAYANNNCLTQEEITIKKDLWKKLSKEAKEVINVILNSPAELISISAKPSSIKKIKKYFSEIWNSKHITENTLHEIKAWVATI